MFVRDRTLVVYGGEDSVGSCETDTTLPKLATFDLDTGKWEEFDGESASGRSWHTTTYVPGNSIAIVFGGTASTTTGERTLVDDLMIFDCDMKFWFVHATTCCHSFILGGFVRAVADPTKSGSHGRGDSFPYVSHPCMYGGSSFYYRIHSISLACVQTIIHEST